MNIRHLSALTLGLFLTACANVAPVAPGTKALVLKTQQTCPCLGGSVTFPSGRYEPQFANAGGTYYRAPSSLIIRGLGASQPFTGGLFLPSTTEHHQGIWMDDRGAQTFGISAPVVFGYAP